MLENIYFIVSSASGTKRDNDADSEYRLVLASNRDEQYDRPTKNMAPWNEDRNVYGGRDLQAGCDGGTWLALSPLRKKIGVLLNLPTTNSYEVKTRGNIVADYIKSEGTVEDYVESKKEYAKECNGFVFLSIELRSKVEVHTYSNATDELMKWANECIGFSNSLPGTPLKKVEAGKEKLKEIFQRHKKYESKKELVNELTELLKSRESHLPDPEIQRTRPEIYKQLSSICVHIPEVRYGTRTHTIILVTKTGKIDVTEITMKAPVDISNPQWDTTELSLQLNVGDKEINY